MDKQVKISVIKFIPGIAWFFIIADLLFLPADDLPVISWLNFTGSDKLVHAGLFFILTLLFVLPFYNRNEQEGFNRICLKICLAVSIWGLTTEFIQLFFVPTRDFDLWDWIADTAGTFAVLFTVKTGVLFRKKTVKNF